MSQKNYGDFLIKNKVDFYGFVYKAKIVASNKFFFYVQTLAKELHFFSYISAKSGEMALVFDRVPTQG
jgi:hypothetical protein